jgi:cell division transport system permease protein
MRANFVLSGVATGVRRNLTMTIALILSTAIALAFVGSAILADKEISNFKHQYEAKLNVSLYLCPSKQTNCPAKYTEAQQNALQQKLQADPLVTSVSFISEAEALARYKESADPQVSQLVALGDVPASFTVKLKDIKADYAKFVSTYRTQPGVASTTNASDTLNALLNVIDAARLFSIIIAIVVLIASILLIANTIQVAAQQRRNETSIMRLVGASRWMTELPFLLETVFAAAVGGIIAFGITWTGKHFLLNGVFKNQVETNVIPNLDMNALLEACGIGFLAGIVIAGITAFTTLRLYVKL